MTAHFALGLILLALVAPIWLAPVYIAAHAAGWVR